MSAEQVFLAPETKLPGYEGGAADVLFLNLLRDALADPVAREGPPDLDECFAATSFPKNWYRLVLVLYAPGKQRILVTRSVGKEGEPPFSSVFSRLLSHPRRKELGQQLFRLQVDYVLETPHPFDFYGVGMRVAGDKHFEIGVDGFQFQGEDGKLHFFLPGDAYVRSVMAMDQLRKHIHAGYGEEYVRKAEFFRFRSESFLTGLDTWLRLYRGCPTVGRLTREKVGHAVELAVDHIRLTQDAGGKFLYYYDAATDSRRDHEHPKRDPDKNPYYNILRHGGGGLTCIYYEKWRQCGDTLENIRKSIDYLIETSFRVTTYEGREGAYVYSERKAKLGGAGIALYLLADYQMLTGDARYREWADRLAWHLLHQITDTGEFIYYNIYLDREVTPAENQHYFSFYYPGEAVCGLAKYLHLVVPEERHPYFDKLRQALGFLLVVRPHTRADQYTSVPSDSWLMMGIMELWDFDEMRDPSYSHFVFSDARQMVDHMYKVDDAPFPDYAGAFYYEFGDYPYADGARCEGLLGAYALAAKMGDQEKMRDLWPALRLAAWSVMHLVNTEDAIYSARNPRLALGGIRFKYTRQWFRIDTIQHVASFYAKMLPFWDEAEALTAADQ